MRIIRKIWIPIVLLLLLVVAALAYTSSSGDNYTHWYEEAMQDDGGIVLVKKLERAQGGGWFAGEPGVNTYGYRSPIVEFEDPRTGETIRWDPVGSLFEKVQTIKWKERAYQLLPYALHFHENVPYMFATFYPSAAYRDWGCPIPPYIIWRWEGDHWQRIYMEDLPVQFKRRNLLPSAYAEIYRNGDHRRVFETPGITVTAEEVAQWVNSVTWQVEQKGDSYIGPVPTIYRHHIHHENIGDIKDCGRGSNAPVPELEHIEMR